MMNRKLKAVAFGRMGENLAAWSLRLKGYRIVARNQRTKSAEIDIIAMKGKTLCFIEVKSRSTYEEAAYSLSSCQQKRLINAAEAFLSVNQRYSGMNIRFDFVAVTPKSWPRHIKNAWYDKR